MKGEGVKNGDQQSDQFASTGEWTSSKR
jgi:hypothetical protein